MNISTRTLILSSIFGLLFTGCGDRPVPTPQEQWQNFCLSYEGAAYNIMYDRQNDISMDQAIEHLKKIPAGQQRDMLIDLVKQAHQVEKYDMQADKMQAMETFKQGKYQNCLNTAHP